jgi:putative CRISPR-associated protein (TIGR02619 family)
MSKTIVCSVGTSAAKGVCPPAQLADWVRERGGPEQAFASVLDKFRAISPDGPALRDKLSAEIHSLVQIGLSSRDRVVLLASETDDGYACALALKGYFEAYWPGLIVAVERVQGVQVTDAVAFRRIGTLEFCKKCIKAINDFGAENVILNPTGGFKALVPYTVLVGMMKRVPCHYIFEQSNTLLELPALPVEFQRRLFETYRATFEVIERDSAMSRAEWERAVPYNDRELMQPLFEVVGDEVTLSGVGLLFLDEVREPRHYVPFLSRKAWEDCLDNLALHPRCEPFRFLERVARSRAALEQAAHVNCGDGLRWLKPGDTTDRYLVSVEDWRLLIWRAVREDQEGPNYPKTVALDPDRERARYAPFTRMEFVR